MSDPIEPVNRLVWDFNYYVLDGYIYKPVTETYVDWVPKGGRVAINNMVLNLDEPSTMVNNLLQLEFGRATNSLFRFAFNSTFGLLGLFDVAKYGGIERKRETFGNVLGRWSVPHGPYLMLPFIGPRSTRILVGNVVDGLYFPGSYFNWWQSGVVWGLNGLDVREGLLGQEILIEQSLDSYIFVKEAYIQYEYNKFNSNVESTDEFIRLKQQGAQQQLEDELDSFLDEIE
ncbi:VacJ family lipoprotein [Psychromonas aquatilis]|uniref:VacJ family lipoprotein n=1 Tax=Psychromonas aquatilis TaxID=2005072 RepID=A0ABU9GLG4_9GAMM